MKKSWMVNSISHSSITGISGHLLGVYDSEKVAKAEVKSRIEAWCHKYKNQGIEVDFNKMAAWFYYDPSTGCHWFITPIEIP